LMPEASPKSSSSYAMAQAPCTQGHEQTILSTHSKRLSTR
jgi:hypothetical protein